MIIDNLISEKKSSEGSEYLQSQNPATKRILDKRFLVATSEEIDVAAEEAFIAWKSYKSVTGKQKANFLRTIAAEIEKLGDVLVQCAMQESGLPQGRIIGERGRTCNQLNHFADLVEEGSWVDATVDEALPDRIPLPRVDIRKISVAIGPVAVFTASNFPLAFSTAGGDTASALAAGCPVIVKAHPSHLGTNALVAEAVSIAAQKSNMPKGVFSSLNGGIGVGCKLVKHSKIKAVGFTGSFKGGKALFDLANNRAEPIPVYAEMGSNNPIFLLKGKVTNEQHELAKNIANSVNLGAGQFCTNPGILVIEQNNVTSKFLEILKDAFAQLEPSTMLNKSIYDAYNIGREKCISYKGVDLTFSLQNKDNSWKASPSIATVSAINFLKNKSLQEEIFGPFTLVVLCQNKEEMTKVAEGLQGQLTATIMATTEELEQSTDLMEKLIQIAGRVIYNGLPTGVEVCPGMHHGGPFPATSNACFTSVGADAIKRFVRPVTYQNMPDTILPKELKHNNPLNIWRKVNGKMTRS
jgi:NADP-dependent aldehyde dehydrogenase